MIDPGWLLEMLVGANSGDAVQANETAKERLKDPKHLKEIAVALTHYTFRNGPVEQMHTDGKLSNEDMEILNKNMMNTLGSIINLIHEEKYSAFEALCVMNSSIYGTDWDDPVIKKYDNDELSDMLKDVPLMDDFKL
ncbi:hypothetical protein MAM33_08235 [Erysipelothrix rhusiopathiae]|uniref:hypothetical protein n=1 Tax=Erysipelothrix rhusiopathiae TaxID=1648 RepID=UPI001EDF3D97|nr:hypothetical protein [Erysipelothrix rhusiopathiae]MCG4437289.1 hypothetical protein [Erysipelothrix rhusiopathiae]